tara:strand:+ start:575 stop:700 length:126 start_codon:yes stop_codon:yes gene_type:complete
MKRLNLPLTRDQYLELAFLGEIPDELGAEEEADLPEQFQTK